MTTRSTAHGAFVIERHFTATVDHIIAIQADDHIRIFVAVQPVIVR